MSECSILTSNLVKLSLQNLSVLNIIILLDHEGSSYLNCFVYVARAKNDEKSNYKNFKVMKVWK